MEFAHLHILGTATVKRRNRQDLDLDCHNAGGFVFVFLFGCCGFFFKSGTELSFSL